LRIFALFLLLAFADAELGVLVTECVSDEGALRGVAICEALERYVVSRVFESLGIFVLILCRVRLPHRWQV
jgi:hypothetical protein